MKKMLKFAAMAATLVAMCASCEDLKNDGSENENDNQENVNGGGTEDDNNQEETTYTVDGKQWNYTWNAPEELGGATPCVLDLGVTTENTLIVAMDGTAYELPNIFIGFQAGTYTVTPTDATSGVIKMADPSGAEVIFTYSELTENSMKLSNQLPFGLDNVTATLAPEKITIMM